MGEAYGIDLKNSRGLQGREGSYKILVLCFDVCEAPVHLLLTWVYHPAKLTFVDAEWLRSIESNKESIHGEKYLVFGCDISSLPSSKENDSLEKGSGEQSSLL